MSLIKGIHHVSMKCKNQEEYKKVVEFYNEILEIPVARTWSEGIMFDTGNGIIEVFNNGGGSEETGIIRHFAFATDNVDECVKRIKQAGYNVFVEPKNVEIKSNPKFPIRIAFCFGPLREQIELFQVR